jgi:hypothetical protein
MRGEIDKQYSSVKVSREIVPYVGLILLTHVRESGSLQNLAIFQIICDYKQSNTVRYLRFLPRERS